MTVTKEMPARSTTEGTSPRVDSFSSASDEQFVPLTIYLATDDAALADQAPQLYHNIRWVTNAEGASGAALHRRNSLASLRGVVDDLYFLSRADAVVGSFSSQVSRLSYELLQHEHASADASLHYHSVDSQWYFGGGLPMRWCVRWRWPEGDGREENAAEGANSTSEFMESASFETAVEAAGPASESGASKTTRDMDDRRLASQIRRGAGQVLSANPLSENRDVLLCETDVAGVAGRVRCRFEGANSSWVDSPAAALERCLS